MSKSILSTILGMQINNMTDINILYDLFVHLFLSFQMPLRLADVWHSIPYFILFNK